MKTTKQKRILCPLDLSDNSRSAIELATTLARESDSLLNFVFVSPLWLPEEAMFGSDYIRAETKEQEQEFRKVKPSDQSVKFEHTVLNGNPGPEIVKASQKCDAIVMATHGHGALLRLMMGSVAQYVLRNAKCLVILTRSEVSKANTKKKFDDDCTFVTTVMHHVKPIYEHHNMNDVLAELNQAGETAAPVIDEAGECIGILTKRDIEHFHELQRRYDEKDPTVIPEMFKSDRFGHIRCGNTDFPQVKRHMSKPVITISNSETMDTAKEVLAENSEIHHLVVVDECNHPVGILACEVEFSGDYDRKEKITDVKEAT